MPSNIRTPAEEKMWKRAKAHVKDSKGYGQDSFTDQDWGLVQTIYQKIKNKSEEVNLNSLDEAGRSRRKRKRCDCLIGNCERCYHGWFWQPYYGKGDGTSDAAISTLPSGLPSDVASGARPGPGGINAPGVPAGPNSGMGPVSMSRNIDSRSIFQEVHSLWRLCQGDKK